MKITLLTSNKNRHNYLVNLLSQISEEVFVIQESKNIVSNLKMNQNTKSMIMEEYFEKVNKAEQTFFGNSIINNKKANIKVLEIQYGDLNKYDLNFLSNFLKSDYYIVFGSSFIKGKLVEFLIKNRAINIHMGISPYYRGTDCNFWALYDNNPHLVGATIHMLSKGLDNGSIIYHAMSNIKNNPFEYTMSTVKAAFHSIIQKIQDRSILKIKTLIQNKDKEIRYSRQSEFNEDILKEYLRKNINLNSKKVDHSLLKEPFFLNN